MLEVVRVYAVYINGRVAATYLDEDRAEDRRRFEVGGSAHYRTDGDIQVRGHFAIRSHEGYFLLQEIPSPGDEA
jgi:hypothetical protein